MPTAVHGGGGGEFTRVKHWHSRRNLLQSKQRLLRPLLHKVLQVLPSKFPHTRSHKLCEAALTALHVPLLGIRLAYFAVAGLFRYCRPPICLL